MKQKRWICEQCGVPFARDMTGRAIRFCCQKCYHAWRKAAGVTTGQFARGQSPWNKNLKGIHLSPESEFKPGQVPVNLAAVGDVRIRTDRKTGSPRAWIKVAEPNIWRLRAVVNWESANSRSVAKGSVVHHIDRDTLNDSVGNLQELTRAQHFLEHREEFEGRRLQGLRDRCAAS